MNIMFTSYSPGPGEWNILPEDMPVNYFQLLFN